MSLLHKTKKLCAAVAYAISMVAGVSQVSGAPKIKHVSASEMTPAVNDCTLIGAYATEDKSFMLLQFDVINTLEALSDLSDPYGQSTNKYQVTVQYRNGVYAGYSVDNIETFAEINDTRIAADAPLLHLPTDVFAELVIAHEQQHMKDYVNYPLLSFYSSTEGCEDCKPREQMVRELMEARAMEAEAKSLMKQAGAIVKFLEQYEKDEKQLKKDREERARLAANGDPKKKLPTLEKRIAAAEESLKKRKARYDELIACKPEECSSALEHFQKLSKDPSTYLDSSYGSQVIGDGTKTYLEVYEAHKNKSVKEKKNALPNYYESSQSVVEECMKLVGEIYINETVTLEGRAVCMGCFARDPRGHCYHAWCPNYKNYHKDFVRQPGDYLYDKVRGFKVDPLKK